MLFKGHNDYELLYLITEGNQDAMDIMINKYKYLVYKKISQFHIRVSEREEFAQEGFMCLLEAIKKYNTKYDKSFCKFFELILVRKFCGLLNKRRRDEEFISDYIDNLRVVGVNDTYVEESIVKYEINSAIKKFNDIEKITYNEYFVSNTTVEYISQKHNLSAKQVYNAIYRIKSKLKKTSKVEYRG